MVTCILLYFEFSLVICIYLDTLIFFFFLFLIYINYSLMATQFTPHPCEWSSASRPLVSTQEILSIEIDDTYNIETLVSSLTFFIRLRVHLQKGWMGHMKTLKMQTSLRLIMRARELETWLWRIVESQFQIWPFLSTALEAWLIDLICWRKLWPLSLMKKYWSLHIRFPFTQDVPTTGDLLLFPFSEHHDISILVGSHIGMFLGFCIPI